ncbi:MAG: primase protein [Candidatus Jorgensenbacteria bacterium GW2011_GWA1_48_13]|uniref:DNA primase n=1 Tax=Candidatus Jorgensenbacteria bacterium GW2011_GWB1_50_10 TaxID=1618665 RepID=A0A0G1Z8V0_9BACT|nr:MAG: primase protein [Candidatus Jorgensenbacteria bacterium GW2011_GWA1_48_13]KKW15474.1 MAG: primase protein [Candidatus Jorgensenbacteria bacterium GW2011_GWB1_50_10]
MARETDLIKERLDLVEFLRSYLKITPAGKNFRALCPFHAEKTPSFIVSPERKMWHCFGCGLGGDIIGFLMRYENLEFPEALRFLAERAGIPMRSLDPLQEKQFGVLYSLQGAAKDFYREHLAKNEKARGYLKERGLNDKTIEEFELGLAPGGDSLTLHLIKKGFDVSDIVRAGLAHKSTSGMLRDRFEGRIIFPIVNHVGKIVAFTGRLLDESVNQDRPKYLNSPETPIFNKSKILFGLNKSKNEIAKVRSVFLVEGQMDFLLAWQAGTQNVAAVSGTGLTNFHLERLRRLADTVLLSFDNDEAGLKALERSLDVFNNYDFHIKVIDLGIYKDPGDACKAEPDFLVKALENSKPAFVYIFSRYFKEAPRDVASKKRLVREMLLKIRKIRSQVEQASWIKELSVHSGISETALESELQNLPSVETRRTETSEKPPEAAIPRIDLISSRLLSLAFGDAVLLKTVDGLRDWLPDDWRRVLENPQDEKLGLIEMRSSYEFALKEPEILKTEFNELVKQLQIESLKRQMEELREEIRLAQNKGDDDALSEVMVRFNVLAGRLQNLK